MNPNVLLIVLDAARADALEPYGARAGSTPALAQLAERGAALRGRATACWTVPSHASIFSGRSPRAAGLVRAPEGTPHSCRPVLEAQADRLLAEVLRRSGYETRAISTNMWLRPESGFATGFERFETIDSGRQASLGSESLRSRARWALESARAHVDDGAARAGEIIEGWAKEKRERPFFWFVNLVECHSPYLPPRPYNDLSLLERWRAARDANEFQTMGAIWRACAGALAVPPESLERMRHLYGRSVGLMDDWVARALTAIDAAGGLEDTLVIVCSDHGENFGEEGLMGHAFSLDERLTSVPLIVAGPGQPALGERAVVGLDRLPALIAGACGLEQHPWGKAPLGEETVLAQFEPPAPAGDPRWEQALAEWGAREDALERVARPIATATDGALKLTRHGEHESLSSLREHGRDEVRPLPARGADPAVDALREAIERSEDEAAAPVPSPGLTADDPSPEELRELEERMKLLGYM